MSRQLWIMLKLGLVDDPRHRAAMGPRVWLYLIMLRMADWPTGVIPDWKDDDVADRFRMALSTVRVQRRELEAAGYIECQLVGDHQRITILRWVNPREYSGRVYNDRRRGAAGGADLAGAPHEKGGRNLSPLDSEPAEGEAEGEGKGEAQGEGSLSAPSIQSTYHIPDDHMGTSAVPPSRDQTPWVQVLAALRLGMPRAEFDSWVRDSELVSLSADALVIGVANSFAADRLRTLHLPEIQAAAAQVLGRVVAIRISVIHVRD